MKLTLQYYKVKSLLDDSSRVRVDVFTEEGAWHGSGFGDDEKTAKEDFMNRYIKEQQPFKKETKTIKNVSTGL
jgi:hypothetical protein